jgi:hypothetical protein
MISRRTFIFCGAIALLPLPKPDPYDQFLNAVRERLIALARDRHGVERLVIFPPRDSAVIQHGQSRAAGRVGPVPTATTVADYV